MDTSLTPLKAYNPLGPFFPSPNPFCALRPEALSKTPKLKHNRLQILSEFQFFYGNSPKCLPKPTKLLTSLCHFFVLISAICFILLLLLWMMIMFILFLKPSFPCSRIFMQPSVSPGNFLSPPPLMLAPHPELFCPTGNSADEVNFSGACLSITLPFFVKHVISVRFHKGRSCISLLPHSGTVLNI